MNGDSCGVCGGDGRIANAFGLTASCPGCHGTGRRSTNESGLRDVTKTKPSHHRGSNKAVQVQKAQWPATFEGIKLAEEVRDSIVCAEESKARLIREIIDYEVSHGKCTKTFTRKIRAQVRPRVVP